jgi:hypothetical protein
MTNWAEGREEPDCSPVTSGARRDRCEGDHREPSTSERGATGDRPKEGLRMCERRSREQRAASSDPRAGSISVCTNDERGES